MLSPREIPVLARPDLAALEDEQMAGQQLVDASEESVAPRRITRAQNLRQHGVVGLGLHQIARQDRFDLRSEEQRVVRAAPAPVQRLDTEPIADEQQPALRSVPDRERE